MNPLSGIYGAASALRNTLYDRAALSAKRLERPVLSVGNLSVGGSGKTPFVIAFGELLKTRGIGFDVLSRGYGRKTRGVLVVDPRGRARDFGDEPLLIARRLSVPVVVGESRYKAGQLAEKTFDSQLHLLDDGFQHRSLSRDFDIVLLTERDFSDRLLPFGRLRETLSSLNRADAVVLPRQLPMTETAIETISPRAQPIWRVHRQIAISPMPASPIVFCGIARPDQFFAEVRAAGISPAAEIEFRDHHAYHHSDIQNLLAMRAKSGAGGFVTTEKDMINLSDWIADLTPVTAARLTVTIDNPADVVDAILSRIGDRRPRS